MQAAVPVRDGDGAESLAARILEAEHRVVVAVIESFARGSLRIEGRRVLGADEP
jgi:phosphoribosylglycinamide formyltransferase-1